MMESADHHWRTVPNTVPIRTTMNQLGSTSMAYDHFVIEEIK